MHKFSLGIVMFGLCFNIGCASTAKSDAKSAATVAPESENKSDNQEDAGCQTPLGYIPSGHSARGYLRPIEQGGMNCEQGDLTCENGVWSGAFIYPSCTRLSN